VREDLICVSFVREVMSSRLLGDTGLKRAFDRETTEVVRTLLLSSFCERRRFPCSQISQALEIPSGFRRLGLR